MNYTIPTQNIVYYPEGVVNSQIHSNSGMKSNWEYRQYLQNNSIDIMKYNTYQSIYTSGNNPYVLSNQTSAEQTPFLYTSTHDNRMPVVSNPDTDLRKSYLQNEQFKSRMISPSIPVNNFFSYFMGNKK